jgi:hypothetical protein
MSVAFGIAPESQGWIESLPKPSQNISIIEVWEKLEEIAEENGLTKLSNFIVVDEEIYGESFESFDTSDDDGLRQSMQKILEELANRPDWFSPSHASIAIRTMRGLIGHLRKNPDLFTQYGNQAVETIISELDCFANFLGNVESGKIRFKFWIE